MPTNPQEDEELQEQLSRLIIENQSDDGSIDISDQASMRDEIMYLIADNKRALLDRLARDAELEWFDRNSDNENRNAQEAGEAIVAGQVLYVINNLKEEVKEL